MFINLFTTSTCYHQLLANDYRITRVWELQIKFPAYRGTHFGDDFTHPFNPTNPRWWWNVEIVPTLTIIFSALGSPPLNQVCFSHNLCYLI